MHAAGKAFVKAYLKAIRDTFFQYVIFLSKRRGKFKLLGLQRDPRSLVLFPSPHEKKAEGVWCAYCNDFLFKQKNYSM